jgi:hypothetical protein
VRSSFGGDGGDIPWGEDDSMKTWLPVAVLLGPLLAGRVAVGEDPAPDPKSPLAPLGRFAGTWEKRFTIYKAEWTAEEQAKTGTHTAQWVLGGRHLQETGRDSDGSSYMSVYSYDAGAKAYRLSGFQSDGSAWQMTGGWDAATSTLTWSRDLDGGVRAVATYKFAGPDEFQFSYVAKDGAGKVYFRLEGTGKRTEAKKK